HRCQSRHWARTHPPTQSAQHFRAGRLSRNVARARRARRRSSRRRGCRQRCRHPHAGYSRRRPRRRPPYQQRGHPGLGRQARSAGRRKHSPPVRSQRFGTAQDNRGIELAPRQGRQGGTDHEPHGFHRRQYVGWLLRLPYEQSSAQHGGQIVGSRSETARCRRRDPPPRHGEDPNGGRSWSGRTGCCRQGPFGSHRRADTGKFRWLLARQRRTPALVTGPEQDPITRSDNKIPKYKTASSDCACAATSSRYGERPLATTAPKNEGSIMPRHSFLVHSTVAPWFALLLVAAVACSSDDPQQPAATMTTGGGVTGTVTSAATSSSATSSSNTVSSSSAATTTTGGTTGGSSGSMGAGGASSSGSTGMATMTNTASTGASGATSTGTGDTSTGVGGTSTGAGGSGGGGTMEMTLTSPGFTDDGTCSTETPDSCDYIPRANSSFHDNESPELNWTPGPEGTQSYALVFHDLSNGFAHWAIWNLSASTQSLPPALPGDAMLTSPV